MEPLITILWEQMSSSRSAQTYSEVWETDHTRKNWQRLRHLLQLRVEHRKWADPALKYLLWFLLLI